MRGEKEPLQSGTSAALKTIYPPELDAMAAFDGLVDKLKSVSGTKIKGRGNGVAES